MGGRKKNIEKFVKKGKKISKIRRDDFPNATATVIDLVNRKLPSTPLRKFQEMAYSNAVYRVQYRINNSGTSTQNVTGCFSEAEAADKVKRSFGSATEIEIISVVKIK